MSREVHDKFVEIKIHTAKCDNCNKHNTAIIFRCQTCGQQCCTPCWLRKGGDDKHRLNGGDQGFTVAGEVLGRRKREPAIVIERRRVRRRTAMEDEDSDKNEEDDSGEGYAEVISISDDEVQIENTGEMTKQGRHRFGKSTDTEPSAASKKQIPEREPSPSILMATRYVLSCAVPSRIHASAVNRLRRPHAPAIVVSRQATTPATANTHSSIHLSPYPRSASDHDGIMALLRAAEYIENDKLPSPSPPGISQRLSAPRDDEHEEEDEGWGQDAQARSPLFMPEEIDLKTQSDGGEAEAWRMQDEDKMLQLDGTQDEGGGIVVDEEETSTGRVPNQRLDMDDGYDEETEDEDWPRKISGTKRGPSRAANEARTSTILDQNPMRATQKGWRAWRNDAPAMHRDRE